MLKYAKNLRITLSCFNPFITIRQNLCDVIFCSTGPSKGTYFKNKYKKFIHTLLSLIYG